jgi:hypothetical protein
MDWAGSSRRIGKRGKTYEGYQFGAPVEKALVPVTVNVPENVGFVVLGTVKPSLTSPWLFASAPRSALSCRNKEQEACPGRDLI